MKAQIITPLVLLLFVAAFALMLEGPVTAETFTTLHSFTAPSSYPALINSDGAAPQAGLTLSGNTLYGTAAYGGSWGSGTVFALKTDGMALTNLHVFTAGTGNYGTNIDGVRPQADLVLSGTVLYGTAYGGGSFWGGGTVFAVDTDGAGFTNLHSLNPVGGDGSAPQAGLTLSANVLYGTAPYGLGNGTVFALNTDGTAFRILHNFAASSQNSYGVFTNSDGFQPQGVLLLSRNILYGTASRGGSSGSGTVFALRTDGTGFTNLHIFAESAGPYSTNFDGVVPQAGLVLSGNTLYGTTYQGGSSGNGTVFAINTDGTGYTNLHSFTAGAGNYRTNSDGIGPQAGLILSGSILYGTANQGGGSGQGTVFALNTDGTALARLHSFTALTGPDYTNRDGARPQGCLILSSNTLYGTASGGGRFGGGTVFSLALPFPQLTIRLFGTNIVLTWQTTTIGFNLQSTTSLGSWAVSTSNSPTPVVVNGLNTVSNSISDSQQFFRLSL